MHLAKMTCSQVLYYASTTFLLILTAGWVGLM